MQKENSITRKIICSIFVVIFVLGGLSLLTDKSEAKTNRANIFLNKALLGYWTCPEEYTSLYFDNNGMLVISDLANCYETRNYEIINVDIKSRTLTIRHTPRYHQNVEVIDCYTFSKNRMQFTTPPDEFSPKGRHYKYKGRNNLTPKYYTSND